MDKDAVYIYYGTVVVVQSLREIIKGSHSLVSDSLRPHGLYPTGLLHPWSFLGKSTGVGCHLLLLVNHQKKYTFFSSAQGPFSRIDHLLGGQTRLNNFKNTEIIENIFCDQSGVKLITQRKLENS